MPYDLIINGCRGLNTNVQNGNNSYYLNESFVDVGNEADIYVSGATTGWFKKEFRTGIDFSKGTYPLKHNFQLSATTAMGENAKVFDDITFDYTSCSYDITPEYNDASAITATAQAGENVKFTIVGSSVISYTQNDKDYNFEYSASVDGTGKVLSGKVENTNIAFHINIPSEDGHNIYVHIPAIVNLNANKNKIGIKRLKNASIKEILETLDAFYKTSIFFKKNNKIYDQGMGICLATGGDFKFDKGKLLFKDLNDAYLKANDYLFTNITFTPSFTIPKDANFSIMIIREYMNKEENYMNRHIRVFSMTDPIDTRKTLSLELFKGKDGKKIGLSVECNGFNFDNAEYYMECSANTSDEEATSVNIDGIPKNDIIYFDLDSIASLASPNATFYAKLENGLILKMPIKFNSTQIDQIDRFVS